MSKWSNSDKFTSWLNLSPRPKITGGKLIGYSRRFTKNSATQALRLAAQSMWKNKGALGRLYRRLAAQRGTKKAIKAIARKLAVIIYNMIKNKTEFDPARLAIDDQKQQAKKIAGLKKEAANLGRFYSQNSISCYCCG